MIFQFYGGHLTDECLLVNDHSGIYFAFKEASPGMTGRGGVGPVLYKNPLPGAPSRVGKETGQPAGDKKEMCESSTHSNLSVTVQNGWHRREGGL
jgi:hypothetical protein